MELCLRGARPSTRMRKDENSTPERCSLNHNKKKMKTNQRLVNIIIDLFGYDEKQAIDIAENLDILTEAQFELLRDQFDF